MRFYCCWLASLYLWMASNYGPLPLCSYIVRILPTLAWKGLNRVFFAAFFYKIFSRARTWSWCGINQILTQPFYESTILRNKKELSQIIWWNWSWNGAPDMSGMNMYYVFYLLSIRFFPRKTGPLCHNSNCLRGDVKGYTGKCTKYFIDMHYQPGRLFQMYKWWIHLAPFRKFFFEVFKELGQSRPTAGRA